MLIITWGERKGIVERAQTQNDVRQTLQAILSSKSSTKKNCQIQADQSAGSCSIFKQLSFPELVHTF